MSTPPDLCPLWISDVYASHEERRLTVANDGDWSGAAWAAWLAVQDLRDAGYVVVPDEPHHYVTFDQGGWFIEHSVACRAAGTIGTCEYNAAIREIADDFDPDEDPEQVGRWRITGIDSEGLPSLERQGRAS